MALADDLAEAEALPREALKRAVRNPGQIAGGVVRALERAAGGEALGERDANLVFWGLHALAEAREPRGFQPLLRLLRQPPEILEVALGETLDTTLARVLASTFDGDTDAMAAAILDPKTDEGTRWSLLNALTTLVVVGTVPREAAQEVARRFASARPSPAGETGWIGWAELVALCGVADLRPELESGLANGLVPSDVAEPDWFAEMFAAAEAGKLTIYDLDPLQFGFVEDAVAELEEALASAEDEADTGPEPTVNPLRHVGRNDPCPCGSGRKFKQCCLGKDGPPGKDGFGQVRLGQAETGGPVSGRTGRMPAAVTLPPLPPLRGR